MKHLAILTAFLAALLLPGCTRETKAPAETIDKEAVSAELAELWDGFLLAFSNGDIDKAMSYLTDDYVNMPAYDITQNYQETKDMFQGMMDDNYFETNTYTQTELFVHSDMAYQFGLIHMVLISNSEGDTVINDNRSISVWKKMEDGSWKLYRWMGQD